MPTAAEILAGLTAIARDWTEIAIAWHLVIAAALVAALLGWRPRRVRAGQLVAALPASAAAFALAYGNWFNGAVLTATTVVLVVLAAREDGGRADERSAWARWVGGAMIVFAWVYPHFLAGGVRTYLLAAPVGLVPCPSLAMAIGLGLLVGDVPRAWRLVLAGAGAFYGAFGVVRLGVVLDVGLIAGALALALSAARLTGRARRATLRPWARSSSFTTGTW